jgi:hypothetical protein
MASLIGTTQPSSTRLMHKSRVHSERRIYILLSDVDMATQASSTASATPATSTASASLAPTPQTLIQAAKLAMEQDRAIMLDYYVDTAQGKAFLGEDGATKERVLVKSKEEFTSLIKKLYKVGEDFIVLTENSLYIVSGKIQKRTVNLASLQEAYDKSS